MGRALIGVLLPPLLLLGLLGLLAPCAVDAKKFLWRNWLCDKPTRDAFQDSCVNLTARWVASSIVLQLQRLIMS